MFNIILIVVILGVLAYVARNYVKALDKEDDQLEEDEQIIDIDWKMLTNDVSDYFSKALKRRFDDENLTRKELAKKTRQAASLRTSLTQSAYGDQNAKRVVKNYIKDLISQEEYDLNGKNKNFFPLYDPKKLNVVNDKFEVVLYFYNKRFGRDGLNHLIDDYELTTPIVDEYNETRYAVTREHMDAIYESVILRGESPSLGEVEITENDRLEIITQKIFEKRFGFGPIDMLYASSIDEIDVGVSGIPDVTFTGSGSVAGKNFPYSYESVWITYHGLNIKLECLSFETVNELVRVCNNVYKYDAPYVMSRSEGRVLASMIDGSRILCVRPPFAESYAFFLRKFDSTPSVVPKNLIKDENKVIPIVLMRYFILGQRNTAITGSQGTGKTTMLKSIIRYIPTSFNLRIQEIQAELNLRYAYPNRNIVAFQETANISAQEGLNIQKKTNGTVNIIGECASAIQASHVIQSAMVASLFALFTHHAKTTTDWVNAIADNLLQIGLYKDKNDAIRATANVLNIDIHLTTEKGYRHIERITEVVPSSAVPYPSERELADKTQQYIDSHMEGKAFIDAPEYFKRVTDPELFTTNQIMHWEPIEGQQKGIFVLDNFPTERTLQEMESKMTDDEAKDFRIDMEMIQRVSNGEKPEGYDKWIEKVLSY